MSEHVESTSAAAHRAAAGAVLRVVAVWLACGMLDVVGVGLQAWVVAATEPGEGGAGAVAALVRVFREDGRGETWAALFLVIAAVLALAQGAALIWAVTRRAGEGASVPLLLLALAGLGARAAAWWASVRLTMRVSEQGVEALASYGVASNVAATFAGFAWWIIGLAVLAVVAARFVRSRRVRG